MFSHAFLNIAGSRESCLSKGPVLKHLPRDPASVNEMKKKKKKKKKKTLVIVKLIPNKAH